MPEFEHDCGRGCACNNCGGCIRAGSRCKIFPLQSLSAAEITEALKPSEERVGADEIVTINVSDLNLAQVGALVSSLLRDPIAIPAERALEPVSIRLKDASLARVVEELGLLTR